MITTLPEQHHVGTRGLRIIKKGGLN